MERIEELREQIDNLDSQLVSLLNKRAEVAFEVKKLKISKNMPILDQEREERIHRMISQSSKGLIKEEDFRRIYELLLEVMRGINES